VFVITYSEEVNSFDSLYVKKL